MNITTLLLGETRYSWNRKLSGLQRPCERFGEENIFLSGDGFETWIIHHVPYWRFGYISENNNLKQNKTEQSTFLPPYNNQIKITRAWPFKIPPDGREYKVHRPLVADICQR